MAIRSSAVAAMMIVHGSLANAQELAGASLEQIRDLELQRLLLQMRGDVEARQRESLSAKAALDTTRNTISMMRERMAREDRIRERLGLTGVSDLRPQEVAALATEEAKVPALVTAELTARTRYEAELRRFQGYLAAATGVPERPRDPPARTAMAGEPPCSIDSPAARVRLRPNCVVEHYPRSAGAGSALSQARMTIEDRVLDRRGVTTQISVGSTTSTATLRIADTFNNRIVPRGDGAFSQRAANWGYSLGIQSQLDSNRRARLGGIAETDRNRRLGSLDRLDAGFSVTGGLSRNFFRREDETSFQDRATAMADAARAACRADQSASAPAAPSTCEGEQLIAWVFARKADGNFANQAHVDAFNQVYWGAHQRVAQFGFGLTSEVARPSFSYYPFQTIAVPDPFSGGDTIDVIDRSFVPPSYFAGEPTVNRHWAYTIGAYGFYHFPFHPSDRRNSHYGVTLVPSVTWKVSYQAPSAYEICVPRLADLVTTNELCRTVSIADGTRQRTWVLGLEARALFSGRRIFGGHGLIPEFAIAPRYTFDTRTDRNALDIPLWFAFDASGQLNGGLRFAWEFGGVDADNEPRRSATGLYLQFGTTFNITGN